MGTLAKTAVSYLARVYATTEIAMDLIRKFQTISEQEVAILDIRECVK
jgi:hypothetical protein